MKFAPAGILLSGPFYRCLTGICSRSKTGEAGLSLPPVSPLLILNQEIRMAQRRKQNTETPEVPTSVNNPLVETGESSQNSPNSLVGQFISLNTKVESIFGIGNIWLTPENYHCKVPSDLTEQEYRVVERGINNGKLLVGKHKIEPIDRDPKTLAKFEKLVAKLVIGARTINKTAIQEFRNLVTRTYEDGYTAKEIIEHCMEYANEVGVSEACKSVLRTILQASSRSQDTFTVKTSEKQGLKDRSLIGNVQLG